MHATHLSFLLVRVLVLLLLLLFLVFLLLVLLVFVLPLPLVPLLAFFAVRVILQSHLVISACQQCLMLCMIATSTIDNSRLGQFWRALV